MPYQLHIDKDEDESIHGAKIVQKTQHSDESYQIFEFADVSRKSNFGVFAINTDDLKYFVIWQPETLLKMYPKQFLTEKAANEMDANIIILRLGGDLIGEVEGSGPLSSVSDGDAFIVNYKRASFENKRDATSFSSLNRDTSETFHSQLVADINEQQLKFDTKFGEVFGNSSIDDANFL